MNFYVTNLTKHAVSIADLALTIQPYRTVDLMDQRHYSYSIDQLLDSAETGSLYRKSKSVRVRTSAPPKPIPNNVVVSTDFAGGRQFRTMVSADEVDLNQLLGEDVAMSDQRFALEFVEDEPKK